MRSPLAPALLAAALAGAAALGACASGNDSVSTSTDAGEDASFAPRPREVLLSPAQVVLARGARATVTVALDVPAPSHEGQKVVLETDDPGAAIFSMPPEVIVPGGETSATFEIASIAVGGPTAFRARLEGAVAEGSVRVVPALVSLVAASPTPIYGETQSFTVTLEAAPDSAVNVALSVEPPDAFNLPSELTIPAGVASQTFTAQAATVGGPLIVRAAIGEAAVETNVRAVGLYLSEILYDVAGDDDRKEWIELYNASGIAIDLTGFRIHAFFDAGSGFVRVGVLAGTLGPGDCGVFGGPLAGLSAGNATPNGFVYEQGLDFSPDLPNGGNPDTTEPADAIALMAPSGLGVDLVIYGDENSDGIVDLDGVAAAPHVADTATGNHSIERTSAPDAVWRVQPLPTPGDCTALAP